MQKPQILPSFLEAGTFIQGPENLRNFSRVPDTNMMTIKPPSDTEKQMLTRDGAEMWIQTIKQPWARHSKKEKTKSEIRSSIKKPPKVRQQI